MKNFRISSLFGLLTCFSVPFLLSVQVFSAEAPGYLVLTAPELPSEAPVSQWWTQLSVQSYTPEGSTSGPTGASQNFSEAEANFMPRLEMGKSYLRPDSTQMNLSLGLAASQTEMRVRKVIGSINSQLTSFLWSARASAYRPFGKWNLGLLGELGSLRLVQSSESVFVNETRQVSFAGIGSGLEKSLTKNLELSALVIARRSFDNEALSLAPVNLEVGVKTKW